MSSNLSVIILNYNGSKDTLNCLGSLQKLQLPPQAKLDTLVVDNHSTDDSVKIIRQKFPQVFLLESTTNLGFAAGNNLGIKLALQQKSAFILLLNNDTLVDKNLVKRLLAAADRHPRGAIFTPKIYFAPGREFHKHRYSKKDQGKIIWAAGGKIDWPNVQGQNRGIDQVDHGQFDQEQQVALASGCCLLLRASALKDIGLFDPRYFLYYEDTDLCIRTTQKNWQIWYIPKAILWHLNASSSAPGSHLHDYFITRNRLLFGLAHAPLKIRLALIRESTQLLLTGRPWQRRGVLDFYLKRFGRGSWK